CAVPRLRRRRLRDWDDAVRRRRNVRLKGETKHHGYHCHSRSRSEDRRRGAAAVRRGRVADHARRHVRGARRRLARPRRALADLRGRVRRPAQGGRRRQDHDRRRRDRPGGEPRRMNREIVITGVGAVTPLGVGARTLYERWRAGESGIQDGVGAATEVDPTEYLSVKEARRADRFSQFAMVASDEALAEAGFTEELPYDADRVATLIGTGIGGRGQLAAAPKKLLESGPKAVSPLSIPLLMGNSASAAVSMRH